MAEEYVREYAFLLDECDLQLRCYILDSRPEYKTALAVPSTLAQGIVFVCDNWKQDYIYTSIKHRGQLIFMEPTVVRCEREVPEFIRAVIAIIQSSTLETKRWNIFYYLDNQEKELTLGAYYEAEKLTRHNLQKRAQARKSWLEAEFEFATTPKVSALGLTKEYWTPDTNILDTNCKWVPVEPDGKLPLFYYKPSSVEEPITVEATCLLATLIALNKATREFGVTVQWKIIYSQSGGMGFACLPAQTT